MVEIILFLPLLILKIYTFSNNISQNKIWNVNLKYNEVYLHKYVQIDFHINHFKCL